METYKTRGELKREVKDLYHGKWSTAVKLNLVPIFLNIAAVAFIAVFGFIFIFLFAGLWNYNKTNSDIVSNGGFGTYSGGILWGFLTALINTGILYKTVDWLRTKEAPREFLKSAFSVFSKKYFLGVLVIQILTQIFTSLWMLLFIIPGIVKALAYSQALFIFKDITEINANGDVSYFDCITKSRSLMVGHKWRLFVLQLSFLGWDLLNMMTLGIGSFWLTPYKNGTYAAFYNDLASKSSVQLDNEW
ncbi:DUF975 family protein [Xylocopilactobacillus apicola]|uniref:Membrane protein n=1 Tax=Xylocopilactobacillus apicola TaxID=2932184 RepID=A0AAU9DTL5_9LACO|nr:DUF975 family protein [Xylocopilactobacillus apicola]BDR58748.1 membrane protein [Xylocopilactobacillus apicola]